jgi:hypothetical protein
MCTIENIEKFLTKGSRIKITSQSLDGKTGAITSTTKENHGR